MSDIITSLNSWGAVYNQDIQSIAYRGAGTNLYIRLSKTNLTDGSVQSAFEYLSKANIEMPIKTPIVTVIPKELMPTIGLNKTNICKVDSAVGPAEFKIVAPVNKISAIEQELAEIKALLTTPRNLSLRTNYVDDEYNKNLQKESELI